MFLDVQFLWLHRYARRTSLQMHPSRKFQNVQQEDCRLKVGMQVMKEQDEKATAQLMTEQDNEDSNNVSKMGGKVQKAIKSKINSFSAIAQK